MSRINASVLKFEDGNEIVLVDAEARDRLKTVEESGGGIIVGAVTSVNGNTGDVTIVADDIGAQDKLTAGNNITIRDNVITATLNDNPEIVHPNDSVVLQTAMADGCDVYDIANTINITGAIKYSDGTELDSATNYRRSPYLFLPKGTRLHIGGAGNASTFATVAVYNESKEYMTGDGYSVAGNTLDHLQYFVFVMPIDGYVRLACHKNMLSGLTVRRIPAEKELNILVLGNSFSQDAFAYLPPILNELLPDYGINYGVAYTASCGAIKHMELYENDENYTDFYLWRSGADHWSKYSGSGSEGYSLRKIMPLYDWDIVYMQSRGSIAADVMEQEMTDENITPGREFLRVLQDGINHNFAFLTGQWISFINNQTGDTLASYFRMRKALKYVSDRLGVSGVIPVGAGIAFARMDPDLDALGDNGHLLYDSHQQAGLPALISTYVIAQYILGMLGREDTSVYGSTFVPNAENVTAINATHMTHGDPVGVDADNIRKAQEIAVSAVAHPDSVYGETDSSSGGGGLTDEMKQALLNCFEHVWWTDGNGQQYYDALDTALHPPANLVSITATFTQGGAEIYNTDSLDTLKQYLTVTARFSDSTTQRISNYTLSGTLAVGTSTITAYYGGKSTTFTVQVSKDPYVINITEAVMSRGKGLTLTAPSYSQDAGSMVSYLGFDLMVEPSKNYQIEWDCNAPTTASIGVKVYNQAAIAQANNGENITYANQRDLGQWFDYGSPIPFTTSTTEGCIRFQIRENGSQAITSGFKVNYLRVKEVTA